MEAVFAPIKYALIGFFGLLALLLVVALLFGKRVRKRWEYEAEFRNIGGNEFGEFDFEMSKIEKEEPEFTFKASFRMRHASLEKGLMVHVYLDGLLVMRGPVERAGRIYLRNSAVLNAVADPAEGQVCRVVWGGIEHFRAPIKPD